MNPLTLDQIKERKSHVERVILTVLQDFEIATGTEIQSVDLSRVDIIGEGSKILTVGLDLKAKWLKKTIEAEFLAEKQKEIKEFEKIITNYKLSHIINTIKLIEDRFRLLKNLEDVVYEKDFYFLESDLQKLIESHYWIFGEEYHLVGAENDKFDKLLKLYYEKILNLDIAEIENHKISKKEVDLLISRKDMIGKEIQNTIVEIKKPNIKIGEKELSQIKNYATIVKDEPKFNANNEKWTYYLVGREYDDFIKGEIENKESNNGLIFSRGNYEIYVLNWADIINGVSFRLEYLKKSLELKKKNIIAEIPIETKEAFVKQFEENTAKIENMVK